MSEFTRFPSTPYLAPPSGFDVRDDKVLSSIERNRFLNHTLHVEEKIDGQNLGISVDGNHLRYQARGSYVELGGRHFKGLENWVRPRASRIMSSLDEELILFGEWCAVTHSVYYNSLPDWFLLFDVYDRKSNQFWDIDLRNDMAIELGFHTVPLLETGLFSLENLYELMGTSAFGDSLMEGVVARSRENAAPHKRAKLVRADFVQGIETHWMSGAQSRNRISGT